MPIRLVDKNTALDTRQVNVEIPTRKIGRRGIILHQRDWIRFVRSCFVNHRRSIFIFTVTANCVGPPNIPEVIFELLRLRKDGVKMVAVRVDT